MIEFNRKQRLEFLLMVLLLLGICSFFNFVYRPYIYGHNIYDYHVADSYSNFFAVPSTQCLMLALIGKSNLKISWQLVCICFAFIIFEFTFGLVCDVYDMISTLISGICTYSIEFLLFCRKYRSCSKTITY